ncbi:MAG: hypothetical protein U5L76_03130 [Patescibacteria group bacterium]|nr:hypothetical protein [Patescibacteria group bacterium]
MRIPTKLEVWRSHTTPFRRPRKTKLPFQEKGKYDIFYIAAIMGVKVYLKKRKQNK